MRARDLLFDIETFIDDMLAYTARHPTYQSDALRYLLLQPGVVGVGAWLVWLEEEAHVRATQMKLIQLARLAHEEDEL